MQEAIEISGDRTKLQRAFGNIIKNAMEAMNFTGHITLQTKLENGKAVVAIRDAGPGMNEETLAKVLEGGFTKGKEEGHGIGTQVVRQAVEDLVIGIAIAILGNADEKGDVIGRDGSGRRCGSGSSSRCRR